jgi:uncharacterized protein DUF1963
LARGARLLAVLLLALVAAPAARADAPTADETVARAQALGVGEQAQALREHFLPGARMVGTTGRAAAGATRLGGHPGLPRGTRWPSCNGRKLSFLMQVRIADIPGAGGTGTLAVFADLHRDADGLVPLELFAGRLKPGGCVAVLHNDGTVHRRAIPRGVKQLRDTAVELRPTLTVPGGDVTDYFGVRDIPIDPWGELENEATEGVLIDEAKLPSTPFHLLAGWSWSIQGDVEFSCGDKYTKAPERRLLLQLDWDERLRFTYGDGGVLYLTITPRDLRAGRYDRLCSEFQDS